MIKKLTEEQEKQLKVYRNKWLKIGLSTNRVDKRKTIKVMNNFYEKILKKKKVPVVILDNPFHTWIAVCLFCNTDINEQVWDQVRTQVWEQVEIQIRTEIEEQIRGQVDERVMNQVEEQIQNQVEKQIEEQIGNQVVKQAEEQSENFVYPYIDGGFSSSYFSFYDYCNRVLNIKYKCQDLWDIYVQTSEFGLCYPLNNICFISDKPTSIKMKNNVLHSENNPAIKYNGGFNVWCLNGVRVTKKIVETPAEQLDPRLLLREKNEEVKREIVRKIGIDKVCYKLKAKCIDKMGDYELLFLDLGDNRKRPYLKMLNPSMNNVWHVEGVHPKTKTCLEALMWRSKITEFKPIFMA